jgi:hypothetical protein
MSWNKKGENEKIEKEEDNESPLKNDNMKKGKDKLINNFNINKINNGRNRNNFYPKTGLLTFTTDLSANKLKKISLFDGANNNEALLKNETINVNSLKIQKEMNPNFAEEFETERVTIVHKKNNDKDISMMTFNLFLRKIVINNFYNEYILYATNFAEQCYYFLKKELVIKKVINCYLYYNQIKVPFNQRKNIIYFLNLLVIKMYFYYNKINLKDEILIALKNFYSNIINEIKQNINKSKLTPEKIQTYIKDGFNTIKEGVNNINKNIKDKVEIKINKIKDKYAKSPDNIKLEKEKEKENPKERLNNKKKEDMSNSNENNEMEFSQDELLLKECEQINALFKREQANYDSLSKLERSLFIYILKVKFKIKINESKDQEKKLSKSYSQNKFSLLSFDSKNNKNKKNFIKKNYFYCLEWDTRDLGEELIYATQIYLSKIKRKELYNGAFSKKTKKITCPGVMENIDRFNKLIFFIVEDILSYDFPEKRAKVMEKWAQVADYCRIRRDYQDIFAISSAFKNYIIANLSLTWKELSHKTKKLINDIDNFCTIEGNYKNVREDMKLLTRNDFYTPYLALLLKDLNFYEENYKYIDYGNLINFDKINGIQSTIDNFFHFQKTVDKRITVLPEELNFFENIECQTESYLDNLATKLEPKFTLNSNQSDEKRLTNLDKKFFQNFSKCKSDYIDIHSFVIIQ